MLGMTAFLIESKWVGFNVILKAFTTPFEKLIVKILPIIFKRVAKTCNVTAKTNAIVVIMKQSVIYLQQILSHMDSKLEEKISISLTKIEILFLKLKVTNIWSNRGRTVCIS